MPADNCPSLSPSGTETTPALRCDECGIFVATDGLIQLGMEHRCPGGGVGHFRLAPVLSGTTQREEWVVQVRWPRLGWQIVSSAEDEEVARERYAWWLEREHGNDVRLVRNRIESTVIEGATDG